MKCYRTRLREIITLTEEKRRCLAEGDLKPGGARRGIYTADGGTDHFAGQDSRNRRFQQGKNFTTFT
jgi:hypothetical protein